MEQKYNKDNIEGVRFFFNNSKFKYQINRIMKGNYAGNYRCNRIHDMTGEVIFGTDCGHSIDTILFELNRGTEWIPVGVPSKELEPLITF